jgi:hypothetical protein
MRHWWIKDRIKQGQFNLQWELSKFNLADCFTKHHPPWHHRNMRHKHIQKTNASASKALPTVIASEAQKPVSAGCVSSTRP